LLEFKEGNGLVLMNLYREIFVILIIWSWTRKKSEKI